MLLRIIRKVVPASWMARARRWTRTYAPLHLQASLKTLERRLERNGGEQSLLLERQDAMFSIMEQRLETLEVMLCNRLEAIEQDLVRTHQVVDDDWPVDGSPSPGAYETSKSKAVGWTDEQCARLQDAFHAIGAREKILRDLITRWIPAHAEVLDLGCGSGGLLAALGEAGRDARGVDASPTMARRCKDAGLEVVEADALHYLSSVPANRFDAITSLHVVEHLSEATVAALLREAIRALRPGGVLVVDTPKVASVYDLTQHYFMDPTHRLPRHHNLYMFLIEEAGFAEIRTEDVFTGSGEERLQRRFQELIAPSDAEPTSLGRVAQRLEENFEALHDWLFRSRDVRIVAFKPEPDA